MNEDSSRNIYGTKNNQNTRDDNNNAKNDTNDNDDNTDHTTIYTSTYTLGSWMILVLSGQDNMRANLSESDLERDSEDVFNVLGNSVVRAFTSIFMARNRLHL